MNTVRNARGGWRSWNLFRECGRRNGFKGDRDLDHGHDRGHDRGYDRRGGRDNP